MSRSIAVKERVRTMALDLIGCYPRYCVKWIIVVRVVGARQMCDDGLAPS